MTEILSVFRSSKSVTNVLLSKPLQCSLSEHRLQTPGSPSECIRRFRLEYLCNAVFPVLLALPFRKAINSEYLFLPSNRQNGHNIG